MKKLRGKIKNFRSPGWPHEHAQHHGRDFSYDRVEDRHTAILGPGKGGH